MPIKAAPVEVNIGPQHPSTHGVFRMVAKIDGERIVDVKMVVGYLHRSMEKLAEERTFTQNIPFTDRMDYLAAMSGNLGYCLSVEQLAGIDVPNARSTSASSSPNSSASPATSWLLAPSSTTAAPGRRPSCTASATAKRSSTSSR